jgi:cobalt-zinc-cadmium efflux system outer membrane protein
VSNPALREAAADVEAARGRLIQAGLYPNPRFTYEESTIGSRLARQGNFNYLINQEIVTACKRRLDQAVAERETDTAAIGLVARNYEVMTRIRRAYYDYLGLQYLLQLNSETVATLERGIAITRERVETARTRPQTDLIRLEALLEEARINQVRARDTLEGAWRQLAAEVGVEHLPCAAAVDVLGDTVPTWEACQVLQRVLATNATLKQAEVEVERARLAVARAKAGAVPNVTVTGGYTQDNIERTAGGVVGFEAPLPLWDRRQGARHEAEARLAFAQAAVQNTANRLRRDVAEAFARYQAASWQVERLRSEVLPRLQRSLELLQKAYQAGSAEVTFSDVLMTERDLDTSRLTLAEARRSMWLAIADLQGLMQLDVDEGIFLPPDPCAEPAPK